MKAIFAACNQAYNEEIIFELEKFGVRGFTQWNGVNGRGSVNGEPHMGSHAWPVQNQAVLSFVPDEKAPEILSALKVMDEATPDLGLRAFMWNIEENI